MPAKIAKPTAMESEICSRIQLQGLKPPPPRIVKLHLKKNSMAKPVAITHLQEGDQVQGRSIRCVTPRPARTHLVSEGDQVQRRRIRCVTPIPARTHLVKRIPNSVKKAFTPKNRLSRSKRISSPELPLTLNAASPSNETTSPSSTTSTPSIYNGSVLPLRKKSTRQSRKVKTNFSGLFRRVARAVRRVVPAEERSPSGETLF